MADVLKGEIDVTGKDGAQYGFRLTTNAICALEDAVGKSALELCEELRVGKVPLKTLRAFVRVALVLKKGETLSNEQAGDKVDAIGALPLIGGMTAGLLNVFDSGAKTNPHEPTLDSPSGAGSSRKRPKSDSTQPSSGS